MSEQTGDGYKGRVVKREGDRAGTALVHPPTTPIPHAVRRAVHMWSVGAAGPVKQPEQTR